MSDLHIAFTVPVNNYPLEIPTAPLNRREFSKDILAEVAKRHGLKIEDIKGRSRVRPIAHARQEAMSEIHKRTGLSLSQIARILNLKDHTSVLHGIRAHAGRSA